MDEAKEVIGKIKAEIDIVEYAISEMESIVNQIDRVNARLRETTNDGSGKDPQ